MINDFILIVTADRAYDWVPTIVYSYRGIRNQGRKAARKAFLKVHPYYDPKDVLVTCRKAYFPNRLFELRHYVNRTTRKSEKV